MTSVPPFSMRAEHTADTNARMDIRLDPVTEDSADSFPASDPPSWTPLHVGSPMQDPHRHAESKA
jgi:hypothetical protein